MPEHIGYMKELGIEYGYGMTSSLEWLLEHIHVYSGMPWWGTIITTAFLTRLVIFPFFVKSSDITGRMGAIQHLIKPRMEEMREAAQSGDNQKAMILKTEIGSMFRRAGVSFKWLFIPMGFQVYMAFCALRLMRASANLPIPGFVDGGALWFHDLSIADPYLGLPALMAATMHLVFRFGGENGLQMNEAMALLKPFMLWIMPAAIFISMSWFPAGVNLWLATTGLFGVVQAKLLQNPAVRDAIGMAPLIKPTPAPKIENEIKRVDPRRLSGMQYQAPNATRIGDVPISRPQNPGVVSRLKGFVTGKINGVSEGWNNYLEKARKMQAAKSKNVHPRGAEYARRAEQYEREARRRGRD